MTGGATRKPRQTVSLPGSPALRAGSLHPSARVSPTACRGASEQKRKGMFRLRIGIPRDEIAAFCGRWGVAELSLFGSALREDFRPDSDVDLLVRFAPGREYGLLAFSRMREELEAIFGRAVDLVAQRAVERSENGIKRRHILETRVVIHATG
jgi:predicted nucleotidyltransferase